jgi:Tannase and feruloyl esterase
LKRKILRRTPVLTALAALIIAVAGLVPTAGASTVSGGRPVRSCSELVGVYRIPGAVTHVTDAKPVTQAGGQPAFCDVHGYVEPKVGFELKLPSETFNGRYVQYGCQGLCGTTFAALGLPAFPAPCGPPPSGDFAVAATDDGHTGYPIDNPFAAIQDGSWAANNQAARNDYFYRAPHAVSVAAKRIISAFYGSPPKVSYFNGCSTGGREGLLEAQRYPHDFNGIEVGSPGMYMGPLFGMFMSWMVRVNMAADGSPILTTAKLPTLHGAVLAACDGLDGLVDGQIDDPRTCHFDPAAIACPPGTDNSHCLTSAQVETVRKIYAGPTDAEGHKLYPGGEARGSELSWDGFMVPDPARGGSVFNLPDNYLKYVGFPIGTPASSVSDVKYTIAEFNRLTPEGRLGNALSLDLRAFRQAGGKLIIWHGWADSDITPYGTLDYYQRLWQHNGGLRQTQEWARLFMVPALYHCALGGDTLTSFDPFPQLVDWVERGHAPDQVIARGPDRTRPVFPYPLRAVYTGTGNTNDARNFAPAPPLTPPHDVVHWAGDYLYYLPGPVAP